MRELSVYDKEAHLLLEELVQFLGRDEIERRIDRVHRTIAMESGIYLEYWVKPTSAFWLGLHAALGEVDKNGSLEGLLTTDMHYPIEFAAKVRHFRPSLPSIRLADLRSRILTSDFLPPVFLEVDTAAHYWQLGYDIEWPEPPPVEGTRSPEFLATRDGLTIEVECKAQAPDSGRMVARPTFYRVADEVRRLLESLQLAGKVVISVPVRLPPAHSWQDELLGAIRTAASGGLTSATLGDTTTFDLSLTRASSLVIPRSELIREASRLYAPHSHIAMWGNQTDGALEAPMIIQLRSRSPDGVLMSYFRDLRAANRQLSGTRPGVIVCFVPEIQSFEGLQSQSSIQGMTAAFFARHAKPSLYAVSYVSDASEVYEGPHITRAGPALAFHNHRYDKAYGQNIGILSSSRTFSAA